MRRVLFFGQDKVHSFLLLLCATKRRQPLPQLPAIGFVNEPAISNDQYTPILLTSYQATRTLFERDSGFGNLQFQKWVAVALPAYAID